MIEHPVRRPITVSDFKLAERCAHGRVIVIDDDVEILSALSLLLDIEGYACEIYTSALFFLQILDQNRPNYPGPCCVVCDVKMPEIDGLELQRRIEERSDTPLVVMSGDSGAQEAVTALRAGALDFLIKPIDATIFLDAVSVALGRSAELQAQHERQAELSVRVAALTRQERIVARLVAQGLMNREIADQLDIALRTVKLYRQRAMEKLGASTLAELVRLSDESDL